MTDELGPRLVIASHNPGKVREIADLLTPYAVEVVSADTLGLEEPEETGTTFAENAILKARVAADGSGLPALADDSGLAVDALGGAPGIFSARWAGPEKDFGAAMERVWEAMEEAKAENNRAAFICALAVAEPGGGTQVFEGRVEGTLVKPPRGDQGFGYDPIFVPDGHEITFGEMDPAAKHEISHRADAFRKLIAAYFGD